MRRGIKPADLSAVDDGARITVLDPGLAELPLIACRALSG